MNRYTAKYTNVCPDCRERKDRLDGDISHRDNRWRCLPCHRAHVAATLGAAKKRRTVLVHEGEELELR